MRILLAIDGSPVSQDAADDVARRPWPKPSTVRVISVVVPHVPGASEFVPGAATLSEVLKAHEADAREIAERTADRLKTGGLAVDAVARQGDPAQTIVEEAKDWHADLIVVGSHGRSGLGRLLLGSVAQAVVSHAPCSVEVVRHHPHAA